MQHSSLHIVSTRPLEQPLIDQAAAARLQVHILPLISTEAIENDALKQKIAALAPQPLPVVFTSLNAATAVAGLLNGLPVAWQVFTIGTSTKDFVARHFGTQAIAAVTDNASDLAGEIIRHALPQVVFFCGDKRREELPEKLAQAGIALEEVVVYRTLYEQKKLEGPCDGLLFFSPGAVNSFFAVNRAEPSVVIGCIGQTTAGAVLKWTQQNPMVISEVPAASRLIEQTIAYFDQLNKLHDSTEK